MAGKPSSQPDDKGWANDGYTLQDPPDPSASQGDSDILRGNGRSQDPIERKGDIKDFERGKIKPLITPYIK